MEDVHKILHIRKYFGASDNTARYCLKKFKDSFKLPIKSLLERLSIENEIVVEYFDKDS